MTLTQVLSAHVTTIGRLRDVLFTALTAMRRVPLIGRRDAAPHLTCLGCGQKASQPCADGCWVLGLENAIADVEAALGPAQ